MRYFFDLVEDSRITVDDEGIELSTLQQVQEEAVRSIIDLADDLDVTVSDRTQSMTVEVRNENGPLLKVSLTIETTA